MKTLILGSHDEWVLKYYILARVYLRIAHTMFSVAVVAYCYWLSGGFKQ